MNEIFNLKNNIFQSESWDSFQKSLGREMVKIGSYKGFRIPVGLGKSFVWFFKAPEVADNKFLDECRNLPDVFVRIEPEKPGSIGEPPRLLLGQMSPKCTRVINLSKSEEEILADMKSRVRYNIRLAGRKGLTVKFSTDPKDIDKFYDVLMSTAGRGKGFAPHPKDYYQKLFKSLVDAKAGKLALGYYEDELIYAGLFSVYGKTAIFMHSGFRDVHASLKAPNYCLWEIIKESKRMGAIYFDMWGIAENDDPKHPWYGISQFKESFGGEVVRFPGTFDIINNHSWYLFFTVLAKARRLIRR
jgi:lipid II:glycine glycyltransferase (peptidoglycan interpeptide bridge formation enzyme)